MNAHRNQPATGAAGTPVSSETLRRIITDNSPEAIEELIATAENLGKNFARLITTSQIRNIFGMVRTIEQDVKEKQDDDPLPIGVQRALLMLRPKLAYQCGRVQEREKREAMSELATVLSESISFVGSSVRNFRNFVDFFEAILAYHRRYGGKTS
ncbi:MAG: type III-A CRISPR-associated protein Csm2 [Chloroflexaceae bacterium]